MSIPPLFSADPYAVVGATMTGKAVEQTVGSAANKLTSIYNSHYEYVDKKEKSLTAKRKERYKRDDLCSATDVLHNLAPRKESPEPTRKVSPIDEEAAAHARASLVSNYGNQLRYVNEKYEEEKKAAEQRIRAAEEAAEAYRNQSSCSLM